MPPLILITPTIYSIEPRGFLIRDLAHATLQTAGTQTLDLVSIRKGTVVVNAWIDVTTGIGATGSLSIRKRTLSGSFSSVLIHDDPQTTEITMGVASSTGYDPIVEDGFISAQKTGNGTTLVASFFVLMVRPDMTA